MARWLGVPPWELMNQPIVWYYWASIVMEAQQLQAEKNNKDKP